VQPHQTQIACFGASRRRSTLLKHTTCHAPQKRWRSWLVSARKGLRSDSPDDSPFTQSPGSTPGPRRKSVRWSDRRPKFGASPNPNPYSHQKKKPGCTVPAKVCAAELWKGFPMSHIARRAPAHNKTNESPDLFSWQAAITHRPPSRAAQYVMRRYRVAPHTAEVIAALAGFGGSEEC
jgi:hypothetical protein